MDYKGVQIKDGKIRIWFIYDRKRIYESTGLKVTTANLKAATRMREEIVQRINLGLFEYANYFPDSSRAKSCKKIESFYDYALKWSKSAGAARAKSTVEGYKKIVNSLWMPSLHNRQIDSIRTTDLMEILDDREWKSAKTRNNCITPVRGIFELAVADDVIKSNPAEKLKFAKYQKKVPDPLSPEEALKVLKQIRINDSKWLNYFTLAFFTGLRTSELIALQPKDVDLQNELLLVERAYVKQEIKSTKNYEYRHIELNSVALNTLSKMNQPGKWLFPNPSTGEIINDHKAPRLIWTKALKDAGIRHRPAYNTRHTFATMNIMSGANPLWVSQQLGHRTLKMLLEHYARWIKLADVGREKSKIEDTISQHFG